MCLLLVLSTPTGCDKNDVTLCSRESLGVLLNTITAIHQMSKISKLLRRNGSTQWLIFQIAALTHPLPSLPGSYGGLCKQTWTSPSSSLVYLRMRLFTLNTTPATRRLDCPHQVFEEMWLCMMAWSKTVYSHTYPFMYKNCSKVRTPKLLLLYCNYKLLFMYLWALKKSIYQKKDTERLIITYLYFCIS